MLQPKNELNTPQLISMCLGPLIFFLLVSTHYRFLVLLRTYIYIIDKKNPAHF